MSDNRAAKFDANRAGYTAGREIGREATNPYDGHAGPATDQLRFSWELGWAAGYTDRLMVEAIDRMNRKEILNVKS